MCSWAAPGAYSATQDLQQEFQWESDYQRAVILCGEGHIEWQLRDGLKKKKAISSKNDY